MRRGPAAAVAHALRVRDGRDRVLRALGGRAVIDAELERPGISTRTTSAAAPNEAGSRSSASPT